MGYIDTSVLVAYYCPEPLSAAAQREMRRIEMPAISPLSEVEFCSVLALKTRTGETDVDTARQVIASFRTHLDGGMYGVVPVEAGEYALACEWIGAFRTPLRTVDAIHLATAYSNHLVLVTADKDLARSARHFGVKYKLIS